MILCDERKSLHDRILLYAFTTLSLIYNPFEISVNPCENDRVAISALGVSVTIKTDQSESTSTILQYQSSTSFSVRAPGQIWG